MISHLKKHCRYLEPQDLTCFFFLQRQSGIIPLPSLFPRSQHVCGSMCLSFPTEAAESHRFSCNTLVNSPACRVIAIKAPVSVYPQFWLILSFLLMALLLCGTMNAPPVNTHTHIFRDTNTNIEMPYAHSGTLHIRILASHLLCFCYYPF